MTEPARPAPPDTAAMARGLAESVRRAAREMLTIHDGMAVRFDPGSSTAGARESS